MLSSSSGFQLTLVGTNHKHAPIDIRERLWCPADSVPVRLKSLISYGLDEAAILSTCNRTEVYAVSTSESCVAAVLEALSSWSGIPAGDIKKYLYTLKDQEAVRHLISVTAGLDSLAVGEPQIREQVRRAFRIASRTGTCGRFLSELFKHVENAGSRIRSQSGLENERVSVSSAVTILLRQLSADRKIRTILLVGAGKMISLAAEDLAALPNVGVWVANRTAHRAKTIAGRIGGRAISLAEIPQVLERADVVLTCTSSEDYVINTDELRTAISRKEKKELVVIDLALPRNVNPAAQNIPGLRVYDIDDLAPFARELEVPFQHKLANAERLVDRETNEFYSHMRGYEANGLLKDLRKVAEEIRERELSRALRKLGNVPPREKTILELLTRRIVNKLLYEPTLRIKAHATNGDGQSYESMLRELFDIGRPTEN